MISLKRTHQELLKRAQNADIPQRLCRINYSSCVGRNLTQWIMALGVVIVPVDFFRCHFFWKKEGKGKLKRQCIVLCTLSCRGKETLLRQKSSPHKSFNISQKGSKTGATAALNCKSTHRKWKDLSFTVKALHCAVCPCRFWSQSEPRSMSMKSLIQLL